MLASAAPSDEEIIRVLRPLGVALVKQNNGSWQQIIKPQNPLHGDWTHYEHNAASDNFSPDEVVGPSRSVRWLDGDTSYDDLLQMRSINGIHVTVARYKGKSLGRHGLEGVITARDAFSGAVLWTRPGFLGASRWSFFVDEERVYLLAGYGNITIARNRNELGANKWSVRAFDLRTGADVMTYKNGLQGMIMNAKGKRKGKGKPDPIMHASVANGKMLQCFDDRIALLDVATGERLWDAQAPAGQEWLFPRMSGEVLVVGRGKKKKVSRGYLPQTPVLTGEAVDAFNLTSGEKLWTFANEDPEFIWVTHLTLNQTHMAMLRNRPRRDATEPKAGSYEQDMVSVHDITSGEELWRVEENEPQLRFRPVKQGGHFCRLSLDDERVWVTGPSGAMGYALADRTDRKPRYGSRNFHCASSVMTPKWSVGSQYFVSVDDWTKMFFTNAYRGRCDFGPLPANGLVYNFSGKTCLCAAFLRSYAAYAEDRFPAEAWDGERRLLTKATPAATRETPQAWPIWRHDPIRSNWTDNVIAEDAELDWHVELQPTQADRPIQKMQWETHVHITAPVTAPTIVGDLLCVADSHGHLVIGMDAENGQEKMADLSRRAHRFCANNL